MTKGEQTRQRLVAEAAGLFNQRGNLAAHKPPSAQVQKNTFSDDR
jgi:hypothetical protein